MAQAKSALTYSSEEIDIRTFFGGQTYVIPYFQRPYTWTDKQLQDFIKDLARARDEKLPQFLGAMILFERQSQVGDPKRLEVVDGQQRLTTLALFICGIVATYNRVERYKDAARLFRTFIWHNQPVSYGSNLRLHPSRLDRGPYNRIVSEIVECKGLQDELSNPKVDFLQASPDPGSKIEPQYKRIRKFIDAQVREFTDEVLDELTTAISTMFTAVTILLKDPTNCSRIFERLNFRGVPVTTGDLVRNEIFAKVANKDFSEIERLNKDVWTPFYTRFGDGQFNDYFFPYGLVRKSSVAKSDVFASLRDEWAAIVDPKEIVDQLALYQDAFLDFCNGTNNLGLGKGVWQRLRLLRKANAPASIYPFIMKLSREVKDRKLSESAAVEALETVEGFLVRRALCSIEPTGLHAVFKALWGDAWKLGSERGLAEDQRVCGETVRSAIASHKTQQWPDDAEFENAIRTRDVGRNLEFCRFLLREFERHLKADVPDVEFQVEHILPQQIEGTAWSDVFASEVHSRWLHTLANLVPLSSTQNQSLGNRPFEEKRKRYRADSMFKSARSLADKFEVWNEEALDTRAKELELWAVCRWPKVKRG